MAKKKKVSFSTRRETRARDVMDLTEIADVLVEEYNAYAGATEELPLMDVDEMAFYIDKLFDPSDIDFLMQTDYGRGMMGGAIAVIYSLEASMEPKLESLAEELGIDEEELAHAAQEEVAEALRKHVKGGLKGGGGSPGGHLN